MVNGEIEMSRDKEYDDYCKKAGIENRNRTEPYNINTDTLGSANLAYITEQQQKAYLQSVAQREDMRPSTPTSPIRTAVELMEGRIGKLQEVAERLFIRLKPITTNTDDKYPAEPSCAREGNSVLNIDLNAMSERLGAITAALQLQIDRLEV